MNTKIYLSRFLVFGGLIAMLVGALDPLEGSFIILPGSGAVALGAILGKSRYLRLLFWAFLLIAVGVGIMILLSMLGGIGGQTGRSIWWGLAILPYPVGWILGLIGAVLVAIEGFKRRAPQK